MDAELRELYQEIILDHNKNPRNFGELDPHTHDAKGHNPLCGDRISVSLNVVDGVVESVAFQGQGCAISTASASMMTEAITGKTEAEIKAIFREFHTLVTSENPVDNEALGKLTILGGVRDYPSRVKCATLAWHAIEAALKGSDEPAKTE